MFPIPRALLQRGPSPHRRLHRLLFSAMLVFAPLTMAVEAPAAEPAQASTAAPAKKATQTSATKTTPAKKTAAKKSVKKPVASAKASTRKAASSKAATNKKVATKTSKARAAKIAKAALPKALPVDFGDSNAYRSVAKAYMVKVGDEIVWENNSEQRLPQASLTKMMTALLILENYRPDDVVEVGPEAAAETGSRLGLRTGDRVLVADLLAAMLIRSTNDACHALADWHSGSEAVFVARMNQRAEQLGLKDTHFMNACGFDNPQHYSTARDLITLAEAAIAYPTFARIVTKERMSFRSVDGRRTFRVKTTNHLLGVLDGVQGVKTGFTNNAGPCLVAMAERNNERVWLVLLNAKNRWWNATAMIDNAFVQGPRLAAEKRAAKQQQAAREQPSAPTPAAAVTTLAHGA